jgi:hypothetical protein
MLALEHPLRAVKGLITLRCVPLEFRADALAAKLPVDCVVTLLAPARC